MLLPSRRASLPTQHDALPWQRAHQRECATGADALVPAAFNVKAVLVLSEVVPDASAALDGISATTTASAFITDIER